MLEKELPRLSGKSKLAEIIRYTLSRPKAFERYLADGRIEIDSNIVERAIRPQTITRKNALFAGSDGGGRAWATIATLLTTAKMNGVDPNAWRPKPSGASLAGGQTARSLTSCPGTSGHNGPGYALTEDLGFHGLFAQHALKITDTLLQFSNLGGANNIFVGLNGGTTALEHAALPGEEL
jgi:hypothetical protein